MPGIRIRDGEAFESSDGVHSQNWSQGNANSRNRNGTL